MITLHHLRIGRSIWTVFLLEELGLEYELKIYERHPQTNRAQDDLKAATPLGKSPVIKDGEITLSESGAITSYLVDTYDTAHKLAPPRSDTAARAAWTQWLHYGEGSFFGPLLIKMVLVRSNSDASALHSFADAEIKLQLNYLRDQLSDKDYLFGTEIQGPDFGLGSPLQLAKGLHLLESHPALTAYLERMQARPAYLRAMEKAGG